MGSLSKAPFTRIGIVGVGLIGGSIGLAVKRRWPDVEIIGVDRQAVLETARRLCVVDGGGETLAAAAGAELVVLAAPVLQNAAALRALPDHLDHGLVTDAGSTKRTMMETAAALPDRLEYIGGHPLAGAAASGVEAARPDLFDDRPWILTPSSRASGRAIDLVSQLVNGLRAVPTVMPADDHDRLLAYLSHLPQLAVTALMHVVGGYAGPEGLALAGRGLRDTTRLASSPAPPWRDIVATNGDNITEAIDNLIAALQEIKTAAAPDAAARLDQMFLSAARWKGILEHG